MAKIKNENVAFEREGLTALDQGSENGFRRRKWKASKIREKDNRYPG